MIDIRDLRDRKEYYISAFKNKKSELVSEVEEVLTLDTRYRELLQEEQLLREELNNITAEIKTNHQDETLKAKAKEVSTKASSLKGEIAELSEKINEIASHFPNPANDETPVGSDEEDNVVISEHNTDKKENQFAKPHWEVIEERNLVLTDEASFVSGTRQIIYNDKAALVVKALERFMLDNAMEQGFTIVEPPVLVNREALYNTGQLPKFEEDLYKVGDQFLIPTGEVPLTNLVANKLMKEDELPKQFVAGTNCFRKESDSASRDTRGLIRLHQFRKVELVTIGKQGEEQVDFDRMLKTATSVLDKLELPYKLLELCTGDISFSAKRTVDIEVWMPGVDTYREISSVSFLGDFQARRMKARYKDEDNKKHLVNTFNGSGLAIGRTLAAIIENYLQEDGMVKVPTVLQPYLPFNEF